MRKTLLALALAATFAAGCSSSKGNTSPTTVNATAVRQAAAARAAAAAAAARATAQATSTTAPKCTNANGPDYIVWIQASGAQPSATELGAFNLATCVPTPQDVQSTSPTGAGNCTIVAQVSTNPGYDFDATPSPKPKDAVVSVGPAC